jgi:hypothetical protein
MPPQLPPPTVNPPIQQPPAQDLNFTPSQNQTQFVTPSETNTTSNQSQNSTGTGTGVSNVQANPSIYGVSSNSNTQVNSGYGENTKECMSNVGCRDVPSIDFTAYYGGNQINNNAQNFSSGASNDSYGAAVRLVVPLGQGFKGNLDRLAEQEVTLRTQDAIAKANEAKLLQQRLIADQIILDDQIIKSCVNIKNTIQGKSIELNSENGSPVIQRVNAMCQGLEVIIASAPPTNNRDLEKENAFLRQKIEQLLKQGIPQKIGN